MSKTILQPPPEAGIRWWNSLTREDRRDWLAIANSATPADAYRLRCQLMRGIHGRAAT